MNTILRIHKYLRAGLYRFAQQYSDFAALHLAVGFRDISFIPSLCGYVCYQIVVDSITVVDYPLENLEKLISAAHTTRAKRHVRHACFLSP